MQALSLVCSVSGSIYDAQFQDAIHKHFLPSIFDVPSDFVTTEFHIRLSHSVKRAGIGVQNPVDAAPYSADMSELTCALLGDIIIDGG